MARYGARTPTSLPKGMTLDDYDTPQQRGGVLGVPPYVATEEYANLLIRGGGEIIEYELPEGRTFGQFQSSVRQYLMRRGHVPSLSNAGTKICGRIRKN